MAANATTSCNLLPAKMLRHMMRVSSSSFHFLITLCCKFWGQPYLIENKQIEVIGYLQTDNIYTFEEMFKIAKNKYK